MRVLYHEKDGSCIKWELWFHKNGWRRWRLGVYFHPPITNRVLDGGSDPYSYLKTQWSIELKLLWRSLIFSRVKNSDCHLMFTAPGQ